MGSKPTGRTRYHRDLTSETVGTDSIGVISLRKDLSSRRNLLGFPAAASGDRFTMYVLDFIILHDSEGAPTSPAMFRLKHLLVQV